MHALDICKGLAALDEEYRSTLHGVQEDQVSELLDLHYNNYPFLVLYISRPFILHSSFFILTVIATSQYGSERGVCRAKSKGQQILCEPRMAECYRFLHKSYRDVRPRPILLLQ